MTYQQTMDYLYAHLPMFSRVGAIAYKEDLDNTEALCESIGNPHTKFKTIHIAGTNGKGSTSHMLSAILQHAGYKTGLYTSPHLKDFRERIKINGEMVSESFVVDFVQRTRQFSEAIQPSFFEMTVAMAFEYFAEQQVDIAVIETGLGGRLDSTNIITPILSIITNIGYDHMNILGNTLEKIAYEKAGIIKPGIPVVIGEYLTETKQIFIDKSTVNNAPIYFAQDEWNLTNLQPEPLKLTCSIDNRSLKTIENISLDLNGLYQTNNLKTVLSAKEILVTLGFKIIDEGLKFALANVKILTGLHGRWDVVAENPLIVLDVAHNEDGMKQVIMQTLAFTSEKDQELKRQLHIVIGMVNDKEISKILMLLPADAQYYFTNAHIPRALPAANLQEKAVVYNLNGNCFDDVNAAIKAAKLFAKNEDLILVCGSVFVVGEVIVENL